MRKRILSIFLTAAVVVSGIGTTVSASAYGAGDAVMSGAEEQAAENPGEEAPAGGNKQEDEGTEGLPAEENKQEDEGTEGLSAGNVTADMDVESMLWEEEAQDTEGTAEDNMLVQEEADTQNEIVEAAEAEIVTVWPAQTGNYRDKSWLIQGDYSINTECSLSGERNTITIDGNLTVNLTVYASLKISGIINTLVVNGDVILEQGKIYLAGNSDSRLLVKGNFIQKGGELTQVYGAIDIEKDFEQNGGENSLACGKVNVNGNFSIGNKGEIYDGKRLAGSNGYTTLFDETLSIGGNLTVCSTRGLVGGEYRGGIYKDNANRILLNGNLYQYGNSSQEATSDGGRLYAYSGNFRNDVTFTGTGRQEVYIESANSIIGGLSATNKELYFTSPIRFYSLESDVTLNAEEKEGVREAVLWQNLDLVGHTLTINGGLIHESGCINFNGGKLAVTGDYSIGKKGEVAGDYMEATSSGSVNMNYSINGKSQLEVGGTLTLCTSAASKFYRDSIVRLRGDLRQYGTYGNAGSDKYAYAGSFHPANIVFCGSTPQHIWLSSLDSYFDNASFENKEIVVESNIYNLKLASDASLSFTDEMIGKQPQLAGTLDLNGHELTITGDYTQTVGKFNINRGILKITGDYSIGHQGEMLGDYRQSTSKGSLVMKNAEDFVYIDGNFTICSSETCVLHNGFMYIKGNFSQYGNFRSSSDDKYAAPGSFAARDQHKVILNGSAPQKVFFESTSSYFCRLELMQSRSRYEFSRPDCYDEIVYNETATVAPIEDCVYTGEEIIPEVRILFDDAELTEGIDYELSFSNNILAADKDSALPPTVHIDYKNGNKGETSAVFTILPREFSDKEIEIQISDMDYTGSPLTPEPSVSYKGMALQKDTDYTVTYEDNTEGGMASAHVAGQGNFTGVLTVAFEIILPEEQRQPIGQATVAAISDKTYTGAGIEPKVEIHDGGKQLREYKDYRLTYFDNVEVGRAAVIVHGIGGYKGVISAPFSIRQRMLMDTEVTIEPVDSQTFTGSAIKPQVTIKVEGNVLKEGQDYTLSFKKNVNVTTSGAATVKIKGKGNCKGTRDTSFMILPASLDVTQNNDLSINVDDAAYKNGTAVKAVVTITDGSYRLKANRDYTLSYRNNAEISEADGADAPVVTITGKGNYAGSAATRSFRIYKSAMSRMKVSKVEAQTYTGTRIKPQVAVMLNGQLLAEDVHYTLSYGTNINAGKGEIYITGKGAYGGTKKVTFTIKKKSLSSDIVPMPIEDVVYDGSAHTPSVSVYDGRKLLRQDRDYTVKYTKNKNAGSAAQAVLTGKGNYSGKLGVPFTIIPASLQKDINNDLSIIVSDAVYKNGKAVKPTVVISDGTRVLKEKKDYTVTCVNNTQISDGEGAGAPQAMITGKGNYADEMIKESFRICEGNISAAKISAVPTQNYTGLQVRPTVTVTDKKTGAALTEGKDYVLIYGENRRVGMGYIYVKGAGSYGGLKTVKFKII